MAELEIIGPADDVSVRICRLVCLEKGVLHKFREVQRGSRAANRENIFGSLPAMRHGKVRLFNARAISHYVDNRFNGRMLLPTETIRGAEVEQWIFLIQNRLGHLLRNRYPETWSTCERTQDCLHKLSENIGSTPWLVGRSFTLADIWLLPIVHNYLATITLEELLQTTPALGVWYEKHTTRKTWQRLIASPKHHA